ncbi:malate dehydrogenase [Candidatus Photodesmus katoptron]|uniref:Malate dehydrogenase n=1 Tax=Candidatus Photodesmus katoptron Akat1 TaxID=1236703 RepID=S3DJE8_9GAMM|nr:malate dehydrogenase [Candidatus Photodesmus katoptron]EPE37264.1 malate dehydrogenase, NAD-dependent [Candidatus Photodesmus katoptron Akat1]KEY90079.1 malate dehydrogenase [Candidatus Photodesmus katoptron]
MKITIIGAAGGIGQALALLLKKHLPSGSNLALYDINPVISGVAVDLSHIPTLISINGYSEGDITKALKDADIILIAAGIYRNPSMGRSALFNVNASVVSSLAEEIAKVCPKAFLGIITNPINMMVPIVAEIFKKVGGYDRRRLFGITTLDVIRSETFISSLKGRDPCDIDVSVIGGHSDSTILPVLSQVKGVDFTQEESEMLTRKIQQAGTEVVKAKACSGGSATLSMAEAACRFCLKLIKALQGEKNIIECAYVEGKGKHAQFFAQPVKLGKEGIESFLDYGKLNNYEKHLLNGMLETLNNDIKIGIDFVNC